MAHSNLGAALAIQRRDAEAIDHYRRALQLKPDFAEAHNNLGRLLALRGQFAEAIDHYRRALQLKPTYRQARSNLASKPCKKWGPTLDLSLENRAIGLELIACNQRYHRTI